MGLWDYPMNGFLVNSLTVNSWHYALGKVAFFWHPPNPDSSVGLPVGEAWFITPENVFPLLQSSNRCELYTIQAVDAPICFHFTITALTVHQGSSRRA
jgi:hypothetical protein